MRSHSSVLLLLVLGLSPVAAKTQKFAILGGVTYPKGSSTDYSTLGYYAEPGWNLGAAFKLGAPSSPVAFRFDASYSQLNGKTFTLYPPTAPPPGPGPIHESTDFEVLSATANVAFTFVGTNDRAQFYGIGGLGAYDTKTTYNNDFAFEPRSYTVVAFGWNAGLGFRYSRFFLEARYTFVKDGANYYGAIKENIAAIPLTIGYYF